MRWRRALAFFAPKMRVIAFPAWDTVPYDRIGPHADIVAKRITALAKLALGGRRKSRPIVLTTVNAILQRVPPRAFLRHSIRQLAPGQRDRHEPADAAAVAWLASCAPAR